MTRDVNAMVAGFLRDLAFVQTSRQKSFGYKRAAAAVAALESSISDFIAAGRDPTEIHGIGPSSARVIREALESGRSKTVEHAVDQSGRRSDVEQRRLITRNFLSRAEVLRILKHAGSGLPGLRDYRGDLQMHSTWSDGADSLRKLQRGCTARGYEFAAVTDHSHGLKIARGMSMAQAASRRRAMDRVNASAQGCHLIDGVEANIGADGTLDLTPEEAGTFALVLAAPHSKLRLGIDQTDRMMAAVRNPAVRILAHPRGRINGKRAGVIADWPRVFALAAKRKVAIEIDGDPFRQDLDHTLAKQAHEAGCVIALDSDAHGVDQLAYAETAMAHAILAGIGRDRIVNCWPLDRLLKWLQPRG